MFHCKLILGAVVGQKAAVAHVMYCVRVVA